MWNAHMLNCRMSIEQTLIFGCIHKQTLHTAYMHSYYAECTRKTTNSRHQIMATRIGMLRQLRWFSRTDGDGMWVFSAHSMNCSDPIGQSQSNRIDWLTRWIFRWRWLMTLAPITAIRLYVSAPMKFFHSHYSAHRIHINWIERIAYNVIMYDF